MELSDLAIFSTVARFGSITRAARELNTVQSNVTNRIRTLELEVGLPLFERHSRGMELADAGKRLLPFADQLATISREALIAARDDGAPSGPLAIGSMETTAAVRLPALLTNFHHRYPKVQLALRTGPTADLVKAVLDRSLDGAFIAGPIEHSDLEASVAFKEELMLVTARRWSSLHEFRQAKRDTGITILVFRAGCSYRQRLEQLLAEIGWPCTARLDFGTLDGIIGCVSADMGVTLLPRAVIEQAERRGMVRAHAPKGHTVHVDTLFVRRISSYSSGALQGFLNCLKDQKAPAAA